MYSCLGSKGRKPPNLNPPMLTVAPFKAKLSNLMTANISGYMVHTDIHSCTCVQRIQRVSAHVLACYWHTHTHDYRNWQLLNATSSWRLMSARSLIWIKVEASDSVIEGQSSSSTIWWSSANNVATSSISVESSSLYSTYCLSSLRLNVNHCDVVLSLSLSPSLSLSLSLYYKWYDLIILPPSFRRLPQWCPASLVYREKGPSSVYMWQ